jgi:tRNA A37 threonylcarbamoyladenosine dehydratase
MTIVDGDRIHISNLNRQLPALHSTGGCSKAELMGSRLRDINPSINLEVIEEYIRDERMVEVLDKGYDYIVDAIDTLSPKLYLIYHSLKKGYPVVSSMGSGGKFDPLSVRIADISETTDCSLAKILRKKLHALGIREGFTAIFSPEAIDKKRVVAISGERNRASVVGTVSYMPAAFGIACASVVIRDIAGIAR